MSRINGGGIFGRPSGKTSGIVFGAARTRTGKVSTTRELVAPSNPNTSAQQTQRSKFSQALFIVRAIGSAVYQSNWNRSIGQLPGFQSMQSIFLNNLSDVGLLSAPANTNLGTLDTPVGLSIINDGADTIDVTWTGGSVGNGTASDIVKAFAIPAALVDRVTPDDIVESLTELYSSGALALTVINPGIDYVVCVWREGQGNAAGLLSVAQWETIAGV
jgi:hypothetical protein